MDGLTSFATRRFHAKAGRATATVDGTLSVIEASTGPGHSADAVRIAINQALADARAALSAHLVENVDLPTSVRELLDGAARPAASVRETTLYELTRHGVVVAVDVSKGELVRLAIIEPLGREHLLAVTNQALAEAEEQRNGYLPVQQLFDRSWRNITFYLDDLDARLETLFTELQRDDF